MALTMFNARLKRMFCACFVLVGIFQSTEAQTYVFMAQPKSFPEAKLSCTNEGLTMAMPESRDEIVAMNTALAHLPSDTVAWFGLMQYGVSIMRWLNMHPVTESDWDHSILNVAVDVDVVDASAVRCAAWRHSDNKWILVSCMMSRSVICYGVTAAPPVNSAEAFSSFTSSSFTIIKFSNMLLNTSPSTVTSRSDIECATWCRGLEDCTFFTQRQSTSECRLYTSDISANLRYSGSQGINVWKINN